METGCLEIIVNRETSTLVKAMRIIAIVLTVCFCLLFFFTMNFLFLIPAIGCGVLFYFVWLECAVDYEYDYVDKELRIAKIQQKQRRKELAVYDLTNMEMLAPADSYQLDSFKNKELKVIDYSSGREEDKADRYVLILSDNTKLILDLVGDYGKELLDILRIYSPRKVFRK